jgi:hypothetical protein
MSHLSPSIAVQILFFAYYASGTFTCASISMRSLSPHREPASMPQAAIAPDFHKPLYVHRNGFAQIPFDHAIPLNDVAHAHNLVFSEIFYLVLISIRASWHILVARLLPIPKI